MLTDPNRRSFFWKLGVTAAVLALSIGVSVFVAVRLAVARDGVAGGPARSYVTVAGTATGVTGRTSMRFAFHRRNATTTLCAPTVEVTVHADRTFVAQVPLDGDADAGGLCPSNLFDGSDTDVDVSVNGIDVAPSVAINPVPYAHYATTAGTPLCPARYFCEPAGTGWTCDSTQADDVARGFKVRCLRKRADGVVFDEVVRVGSGNSAFWIDRYESSVWDDVDGSGFQRLRNGNDIDEATFPRNGQWTRPLYALSRGQNPEIAHGVNWFQASAACAASGKRLPTDEEWLKAARRTVDPGPNNGITPPNGRCHTLGSGYRRAGLGVDCESACGAQDMIGNVREWTGVWVGTSILGNGPDEEMFCTNTWQDRGANYFGDSLGCVRSWVYPGGPGRVRGPSAPLRGGSVQGDMALATASGVFAYDLYAGPSNWDDANGFRCVIPR